VFSKVEEDEYVEKLRKGKLLETRKAKNKKKAKKKNFGKKFYKVID
jgi:hypothetical protein